MKPLKRPPPERPSLSSSYDKVPSSGKVISFPDRSCAHCEQFAERGCVDAESTSVSIKHHGSYATFSFLPKALQRWRDHRGMKISAAAQGLGVAASTWGHWETGYRFPTGSVLLDLVRYTGLSLVELICEHGEHCPLHQMSKPDTLPQAGQP